MPSRRLFVTAPPLALSSTRLPPVAASASMQAGDGFMHRLSGQRNYEPDNFKPDLAFVIMSFSGRKMLNVYSAIKDECKKIELNVTRVDENVGAGFILGEIITLIETAEFIICDLSDERPNVYYELGYAHGIGNQPLNILVIAREGTVLQFDVSPFRVQFYRSPKHLRSIIATTFKTMVESKRKKDALYYAPASSNPP
jgi:hypothetical protein